MGVLQHIAGATGVLTYYDLGLVLPAVIPAQETADLVGVIGGQAHPGLAPESVSSKVFSHCRSLFLLGLDKRGATLAGVCDSLCFRYIIACNIKKQEEFTNIIYYCSALGAFGFTGSRHLEFTRNVAAWSRMLFKCVPCVKFFENMNDISCNII